MSCSRPFQRLGLFERVMPFVAVSVAALVTLLLSSSLNLTFVYVATAYIGALVALIFLVPWERLPRWTDAIVPLVFLGVVVVLREAQGGSASSMGALVLLPVIWFALYGTGREFVLSVVGALAVFVVPVVMIGPPHYPIGDLGKAITLALVVSVMGWVVRRLVVERQQLTLELERSNAELEVFASAVAHDLGEPLTVISRYAEMLESGHSGSLDDEGGRYLAAIVRNGTRMRALIDGLLTVARIGGSRQPDTTVDTQRVLDNALESLAELVASSGADVNARDLPQVLGDETQLTQVFQNLVGNSIKFAGDEVPAIDISARRAGRDWCFTVADNGVGIPPDRADRAFELFRRLQPGTENGYGIGLAVAKRVVERHGGRIWVEPSPGRGTRISFTIPAAASDFLTADLYERVPAGPSPRTTLRSSSPGAPFST